MTDTVLSLVYSVIYELPYIDGKAVTSIRCEEKATDFCLSFR